MNILVHVVKSRDCVFNAIKLEDAQLEEALNRVTIYSKYPYEFTDKDKKLLLNGQSIKFPDNTFIQLLRINE